MTTNLTAQARALASALALCEKPKDREIPDVLVHALARRDQLTHPPTATDVARAGAGRLAAASAEDYDQVLDELSSQVARAHAVELAGPRGGRLERALGDQVAEAYEQALTLAAPRLAVVAEHAIAELHAVAPELPVGEAAVDPAALLEADAGSAHRRARAAAHRLLALGAVPVVRTRADGSTPHGTRVVVLVDLPTTTVTQRDPLSERVLNTEAERRANRATKDLVARFNSNPELALIDVARDVFGGVALSHTVDPQAIAERVEAVRRAHLARRLREAPAAGVMAG